MDIQQTDKESLAAYVHRFKQEANRCKFNNDTATIRIFLKGLKNAHTIATKVYEKGPQTLADTIKEVEKLQAAQQIISTLLPTSSVNTMSSDNDKHFQCQETGHMACYCPHIRCFNCDNYGHVAADCPDKIPPSGTPVCCRGNTTSRHDRSSSRHHSHNRHYHCDYRDRHRFSHSRSHPHNPRHRSNIHHDSHRSCSRSLHRPSHYSSLVHTATTMTHHITDPHPIEIFPEMTADPNYTNPTSNIINQHKDLLQVHKLHLGKIRTEDTNKLQLTILPQNTIVQMIRIATPRTI